MTLQAYYALRRLAASDCIGTEEILAWIRVHEPRTERPSGTIIRMALLAAGVPHRPPGRPTNVSKRLVTQLKQSSPFLSPRPRRA